MAYTPNSSSDSVFVTPVLSSRLVELAHGEFEYVFSTPTVLHYYATRSKDRFLAALIESGEAPSSLIEFVARFLLFAIRDEASWVEAPAAAHVEFVELVLRKFRSDCLQGKDIHTVASNLPGEAEQRNRIVQSYYTATSFSEHCITSHPSALFKSAASEHGARLYGVFGGQGNTEQYFQELRDLYATYAPLIKPLLVSSGDLLHSLLQKASVTTLRQYAQGLDVMQWLQSPDSTPSSEYLLSAPVSFPLIGLIQLANYSVMCNVLGSPPGELTRQLSGVAGHSQGVIIAAAIAVSDSWESFEGFSKGALTILFTIGSHAQEISPSSAVPSKLAEDSVENGEGIPSPMLNVSDIGRSHLEKHIDAVNEHLDQEHRIEIALINGASTFVVSGPASSLCALNVKLRQIKASKGLDQGRVAFSSRKPQFTSRFLPISAAFHSQHLEEAHIIAIKELEDIEINSRNLLTSVYHTRTGADLKSKSSTNIVPELVRMVTCDLVDWPKTTQFSEVTHMLDFGPGGLNGIGSLTHRNKEGTGVRTIFASLAEGASTEFGYRPEIFNWDEDALVWGSNWQKDHGSKLVKSQNGGVRIDNAMTRLLGLPPVMVAGMTPTTVAWDFVSAITNAGFHVELAGGGYFNAEQMSSAITKLHKSIPVGRGICLNLIYAKPQAIRWQISMIRRMRSEGVPIEGLTFGAGVPSPEVANEYIESLRLRYICFKPGSLDAIKAVIDIAQAHSTFPIMLQWTGGRGGGHHSYEDFHEPIVRSYGKIRRCKNVVLVAGSGFGGAEDTYPYISGVWARAFGRPPMPFDGCLFGSRMMVAKEAKTSKAVKEAIIATPGVIDKDWEKTYTGVAGGIITVRSEMGEPIHKIATRGVLFWRELDDTIFSISDKAQRLRELQTKKSHIINRLNQDFQKVWFGKNETGETVDLEDMTYVEVLTRLIQLLYVSSESRWIDKSYVRLVEDFLRRAEGRLGSKTGVTRPRVPFDSEEPFTMLEQVVKHYPDAKTQVITFDDARYFILLCQRPGQKPVTFVPTLDENFEIWFKKDSLWQAEDIAAVVDEDVGRTCILQGPVSAKHCTVANEPVGSIMENVTHGLVRRIFHDIYNGNIAKVSAYGQHVEDTAHRLTSSSRFKVNVEANKTTFSTPSSVSQMESFDVDEWLKMLAGPPGTWRYALITCQDIIQGRSLRSNPIRRVLTPVPGLNVEVYYPKDSRRTKIVVSEELSAQSSVRRDIIDIDARRQITVTLHAEESAEETPLSLTFIYTFHPERVAFPIQEVMEDRNDRLRKFYYHLWFGDRNSLRNSQVTKPQLTLNTISLAEEHERRGSLAAIGSFHLSSVAEETNRRASLNSMSLFQAANRAEETYRRGSLNVINAMQAATRTDAGGFPGRRSSSISASDLGSAIGIHTGDLLTPMELRGPEFNFDSPTKARFHGQEVTISVPAITKFASSLGGPSKNISSRTDKTMAPLDFAIVVGWEAMMKAIFPKVIDGEFLNLVHLSNKFQVLQDAAPLSSSDNIESSAEIFSIMNQESGRVVEVGAVIEREKVPVLELTSQFLFRGTYDNYDTCFQKKVEPSMELTLDSSPKLAVLRSKPWIHFTDSDFQLLGQRLVFQLESLTRYEDPKTFRSVETFGFAFVFLPSKQQKLVAEIQYSAGQSTKNPVVDYLCRHGSEVVQSVPLKHPQPLREQDSLRLTTPASNQAYARASGDFNPIHVSRTFASYANLPGTITHGMYTSAAVRQLVEIAAGLNEQVRMKSYEASFVGMVLPRETIEVQVNHVAMKDGLRVLSFQAVNVETGEKVLVGEAEVDQPVTTYVFTGQGSQQPDMGMDLYATSEVAREIWDRADQFFSDTYGFVISGVVKQNPKQLTIHFGGRRGFKIRQNYIDMILESPTGVREKFFKSIDETTSSYTFRHEGGLLFSTEFAQPALAIMERAQYVHLRSKGLFSEKSLFAGHSLGEYSALATIGDIMPLETLLSVSFYRGLTMQAAVERDGRGRSMFSMLAVNPSRINRRFSQRDLQLLVKAIREEMSKLLEIVNYNIDGQQYVCAGELGALDCLIEATNSIASNPEEILSAGSPEEAFTDLVVRCMRAVVWKPQPVQLVRGKATTPLVGIDVPFHSSFLLPKLPAFRNILLQKIPVEAIDPEKLVGKYVPNVTAKPFDISRQYFEEVQSITGSQPLAKCLVDWPFGT